MHPVQPVVQERSRLTDIEILLQSMLPVGSVMEVDVQGVFRVASWTMQLSGALFWMSRFLSCHRGGGRTEWMINLYYDRPRGGLPVSKRETSTDTGRGVGHSDQ